MLNDSISALGSASGPSEVPTLPCLMALAMRHGSTRLHLPPSSLLRSMQSESPAAALAVFRLDAFGAIRLIPGCLASPAVGEAKAVSVNACLAPAGSVPRLLLISLVTEAIEAGVHRIDLGKSTKKLFQRVGINRLTGGKNGTWNRGREQIRRLFGAEISFRRTIGSAWLPVFSHTSAEDLRDPGFSKRSSREKDQLLGATIEFSSEFISWCKGRQVIGDLDALKQIKSTGAAIDLYAWLSEREAMDLRRVGVLDKFGAPSFSTGIDSSKEFQMARRMAPKVFAAAPSLARHAKAVLSKADPEVAVDRVRRGVLGPWKIRP